MQRDEITLNLKHVIAGILLLCIFGAMAIFLTVVNNGVTQELTFAGDALLACFAGIALLGVCIFIIGLVEKATPKIVSRLPKISRTETVKIISGMVVLFICTLFMSAPFLPIGIALTVGIFGLITGVYCLFSVQKGMLLSIGSAIYLTGTVLGVIGYQNTPISNLISGIGLVVLFPAVVIIIVALHNLS